MFSSNITTQSAASIHKVNVKRKNKKKNLYFIEKNKFFKMAIEN